MDEDTNARAAAKQHRDLELVGEGLVGVGEAGKFLGLSRSTLYLLMEGGILAFVKIGRARRIPRRSLVELAAKNLQGGWRVPNS